MVGRAAVDCRYTYGQGHEQGHRPIIGLVAVVLGQGALVVAAAVATVVIG